MACMILHDIVHFIQFICSTLRRKREQVFKLASAAPILFPSLVRNKAAVDYVNLFQHP